MANLLRRLTGSSAEARMTMDGYIGLVNEYGYNPSIEQSWAGNNKAEPIGSSFVGYASSGFMSNGVVSTCMNRRQFAFSSMRLRFQRLRDGKPSDMFGTPALRLLETPGPGETTQDMLSRMIQDADLAGNSYQVLDTPLTRLGGDDQSSIIRLRPDWVEIVAKRRYRPDGQLGWQRVGYIYTEGGKHSGNDWVTLGLDEVAHFAPIPDPLADFRGMSWLTPVVREIENDSLMTRHKRRFFENGATPNMIIKHPAGADRDKVLDFQKRLDAENSGTNNAYKTLNLYPGADATVVGANMQQLDFKSVQGAGETRIAAAAMVPPVIAGLSEGLQGSSLNDGNFSAARRLFVDGTMHPLWQNAAGSLSTIIKAPGPDTRLWYDADDIPFLREDEKDAAEITQVRAATVASLLQAGYTPESVAKFMQTPDDFRVLVHSGLYSVQLQKPGGSTPAAGEVTAP
ncbi:MAG: phage portal protein [Phycisphaerales bacterium]